MVSPTQQPTQYARRQLPASIQLLRGDLAARRLFPAVDVVESGTRRADLLLAAEELAVVEKLRRGLAEGEPQQAVELLLERLGATQTNYELLRQVQVSS